jgi:5-methylcytosine-specific restriction enzyme subunit McrC
MELKAKDSSPILTHLTDRAARFLKSIAENSRAGDYSVSVGGTVGDDEPIVYTERDGTWWTGRFIGTVSSGRDSLTIEPRYGIDTSLKWLTASENLRLVRSPGALEASETFIAHLLAILWGRAFVDAARHGLPSLPDEIVHTGSSIRGRLDLRRSIPSLQRGDGHLTSISREKTLDHAVTRVIVAAHSALKSALSQIPERAWLPKTAMELVPRLVEVTGRRPIVPSEYELSRIRYTPITLRFRELARLSHQIASHRGLATNYSRPRESEGVLIDVAELWERFVLAALRRAAPSHTVEHGTYSRADQSELLTSITSGKKLGRLKPDYILSQGRRYRWVADAKYKRIWPNAYSAVPQTDDLYQVAAYSSRYGVGEEIEAALIYPRDPSKEGLPPVVGDSPWSLPNGGRLWFVDLPHDLNDAANELSKLINDGGRLILDS